MGNDKGHGVPDLDERIKRAVEACRANNGAMPRQYADLFVDIQDELRRLRHHWIPTDRPEPPEKDQPEKGPGELVYLNPASPQSEELVRLRVELAKSSQACEVLRAMVRAAVGSERQTTTDWSKILYGREYINREG